MKALLIDPALRMIAPMDLLHTDSRTIRKLLHPEGAPFVFIAMRSSWGLFASAGYDDGPVFWVVRDTPWHATKSRVWCPIHGKALVVGVDDAGSLGVLSSVDAAHAKALVSFTNPLEI